MDLSAVLAQDQRDNGEVPGVVFDHKYPFIFEKHKHTCSYFESRRISIVLARRAYRLISITPNNLHGALMTEPLQIHTLGRLTIQQGETPITGFISRKVGALL